MNNSEEMYTTSKKRFNFHPKLFLKNLQQKIYRLPSSYLAMCFIVPVAIMIIIYLTRALHPFGDGTPLVLDLNAQYSYFFEGLRNLVYGDATSFLYSFSRSLGGEFMGMYAYYLASPLSYIVVLFPQDRIQEAILTIILIKAGLSGLSFGYFLHKHSEKANKFAIITFSAMYALSAYAVCQQSNTMWIDALVWLPLMTLGVEQLILNRKYKLYTISLSIILISNYYIGYMMCIFAVLYFFYYYFSKSPSQINPRNEKLHFIRAGARFAVFSLISAAIAAFMLVAAYYSLGFGKSEFSSPNWAMKSNFDVIDFLVKFLPGSYDTFEPSGLPFIYCGLLTLILLPVYFMSKRISPREKVASIALIAFFLISFFLNPIDLIWHGFSMPNWLNARYSFLFCFVLLTISYKGFGNLKEAGERFLLGVCAFLVLFVAVAEKFELKSFINSNQKLLTFGCIWFSIFFITALLVLLCLNIRLKPEKSRRAVSAVLCAVVCAELLCNGIVCFIKINDDVHFARYSSYRNFLRDIRPTVNRVKEYDDGFYRMEKLSHRQKNDNFALAIRGISNSTSTLNAEAIEFLNRLGYTGRAHLTQYNGGTPLSDSLLGIKYVLDRTDSTKLDGIYEKIDELGDEKYEVYKNPYALSIAYAVSDEIKNYDMELQNVKFRRGNELVSAMLGSEKVLKIFKAVSGLETSKGNCTEVKLATTFKYNSPEDTDGTFSFTYTAPKEGYYYFYPSTMSSTETCQVKIGNNPKISYLERDTDHILSLGYFEKDEEIKITFFISSDDSITFKASDSFLWYFDTDLYENTMQQMCDSPQLKIDGDSVDSLIKGTMTTVSDTQTVLTTIPYDEGWNVYVDGEKVEIYKVLDALMAFDISEAGEHSIVLKYMPGIYKVGIALSVVGIVAFVLICAADFILKKTIFKNKVFQTYTDTWVLPDFDNPENAESNESKSTATGCNRLTDAVQNENSTGSDAYDNDRDTTDNTTEE